MEILRPPRALAAPLVLLLMLAAVPVAAGERVATPDPEGCLDVRGGDTDALAGVWGRHDAHGARVTLGIAAAYHFVVVGASAGCLLA